MANGRVDFTDDYEFSFVVAGVTAQEREAAKSALADKVEQKVAETTIPEATFAFDKPTRETVITIVDKDAGIHSLSGSGAMAALAETEEVRGYNLGGKTRNFYGENGIRKDDATIKGWIVEDVISALGLNLETGYKLGALEGENLTVEVIGLANGRVDFTDDYEFSFVVEPAAGAYFDELWDSFKTTINNQAQTTDPKDKITVQLDFSNKYVNIKILDSYHNDGIMSIAYGTGLYTAVINLLKSEKVVKICSAGYVIETLDNNGGKKTDKELQDEAFNVAVSWLGSHEISTPMKDYLIGETIDFILYGVFEDEELSVTYHLTFQ